MDDETAPALAELVTLANELPGAFRPEFELGYWSGVVDGAEPWYVHFEGDIEGTEFMVMGLTATEALRKAAAEAKRRSDAVSK